MAFIDDQPLIWSQSQRAMFEVNQIGAYIGCRLEEGVGLNQLTLELQDRGGDAAAAMLKEVLAEWSHSGIVCAKEQPPESRGVMTQFILLGGVRLALRYHDPALADHIAPVFAHLEDASASFDRIYDIWSHDGLALLSEDAGQTLVMHPAQAATIVKARLTQNIIDNPRWAMALHTACLRRNGRALLLTGRPGAGKTTLTCGLSVEGFAYQGDDIAMLDVGGRVQGLPFLPTIKSGAWQIINAKSPGGLQPAIHKRTDGKRARYLMPPQLAEQTPLRAGWIVALHRRKGEKARLVPVSPVSMIKRLLAEATSASREADRAALDGLVQMVAAARNFELHYGNLNEAAALLATMCDDGAN